MTTPATPSAPKPAGDDRNLVAVDVSTAASFEERLHLFWKNNGNSILTLVGLVLVGIIAKGGLDYFSAQKELGIEKDYAVATTPEQLKAFATSHTGHSLAGIALLRVADDAYAAGKTADALTGYEQALPALKGTPLAARAQLGRALAKIGTGKGAEGTAELKQLADDARLTKGVRAEAMYHLASLANDVSNSADVQKYSEALMRLDPSSPWTQRVLALRASLPTPAAATDEKKPAEAGKPDASAPMQVKLPGK